MRELEGVYRTRVVEGETPLLRKTDRYDRLLLQAIKQYQIKYEKKFGEKPTRSKLFSTSLLEQNEDVRVIYEQLKEKAKHVHHKTKGNSKPSSQGPRTEPSEPF